MVKFIKPISDNSKKSVEIEKNPDGYFTITLRISFLKINNLKFIIL